MISSKMTNILRGYILVEKQTCKLTLNESLLWILNKRLGKHSQKQERARSWFKTILSKLALGPILAILSGVKFQLAWKSYMNCPR